MEKDLISVIVPCYNVALYLEDFFKSIENLTYTNYEVIFVNDGSTDETLKLLQQYVSNHSNARIVSKENGGASSARNEGIKIAKGSFVYFPDPDDFFSPNILTVLHSLIVEHNADVATCSFNKVNHQSHYKKHNAVNKIKKFNLSIGSDETFTMNLASVERLVWNKLYKIEILKRIENYPNVFDENCKSGEDGLFNDYYFLMCNKAVFCKNKLYFWRKRGGSLSHSGFSDENFNYLIKRMELLESINKDCYCNSQIYYRASMCLDCMEEIRKISHSPNYNNPKLCNYIYDKYKENLKYLIKGKMFPIAYRFGTMFTKPVMYLMIRKHLK